MKNKLLLPYLSMLLAAVLLVLCILLPYGTAKGEYRQWLEKIGDTVINRRFGLSGSDLVKMSLLEYAKLDWMNVQNSVERHASMLRLMLTGILAVFCLLTALFAVFRKPIAAIAFSLFTLLIAFILSESFAWNRIVPSEAYDRGAAYVLFYVLPLLVIAAALWLMIAKNRSEIKKE